MFPTGGPLTNQNVPDYQPKPHQHQQIYSVSQTHLNNQFYSGMNHIKYQPTVKKSMSFFTTAELISYKTIPAFGAAAYLASAIGATAMDETFVQ